MKKNSADSKGSPNFPPYASDIGPPIPRDSYNRDANFIAVQYAVARKRCMNCKSGKPIRRRRCRNCLMTLRIWRRWAYWRNGLKRGKVISLQRFARHRVLVGGPSTQINHFAALATERTEGVGNRVCDKYCTLWATNFGRRHNDQRLQKVRSNSTSCSKSLVR